MPATRTVRTAAYRILRPMNLAATSHPGMIRGFPNWSRGVTVETFGDGGFYLCPRYDIARTRESDLAAAVAALRVAGWTVQENGVISEIPTKEGRKHD